MARRCGWAARFAATNPRALELGSGIGFTALALASLGWDVLATDTRNVVQSVLDSNIQANLTALPQSAGSIETRELDWTVPPDSWCWDNPLSVTSLADSPSPGLLQPPFDLIISADTVVLARAGNPTAANELVDTLFAEARDTWGFSVDRVPSTKLAKSLDKGGLKWSRSDWEDVEVWKLRLR
ncbi:hypothetical protein DFP72DRAFT_840068 [Ephemerocybe angulata]|uniref:Uncharacterized protein n=1 Tax=Ephemerocybe angulata TaxID=980116 RepID=A0A8H6MG51_9AGAR|nr:hypothetical protein DFP72DRAFT_840068 [Tulosesus angulatus]